jgi:hypothetical protein
MYDILENSFHIWGAPIFPTDQHLQVNFEGILCKGGGTFAVAGCSCLEAGSSASPVSQVSQVSQVTDFSMFFLRAHLWRRLCLGPRQSKLQNAGAW